MGLFMTTFRVVAGLAIVAGVTAAVSLVAAQGNVDGKKYDKGATVTLQGCVVAADKKDTYVLSRVQEWPIANSEMSKYGPRYYWIDKRGDDMKAHLGHTIQVVGKITDVEKSEIELKPGEKGVGQVVEIEGPGRDIVTSATNAGVNMATRPNTNDIPITLLKLKVDELKMVSSSCAGTM
jgi:hypothetical protein